MIVLYETSSRNNAMELERQLIDYYKYNYETCENRGPGAEGSPGEGWYYVYVVRRNWIVSLDLKGHDMRGACSGDSSRVRRER